MIEYSHKMTSLLEKEISSPTKKIRGFTLIELMVAIGIVTVLLAVLLPNYHSFFDQLALTRSAYQLAQHLRRAQEMAISSQELADGTVPKGYGIYFEKTSNRYILYADRDGTPEEHDASDQDVQTMSPERRVAIHSIEVDSSNSEDSMSVNFKGPSPLTKITGPVTKIADPDGEGDSTTITLVLENDPTKTKTIYVNKAGLIYVQ